MDTITVGLIGLGDIIHVHLDALNANPEYRLVGVCDKSPQRLRQRMTDLDVEGFENYQDLLDQKPDMVVITLPHYLHAPVAIDALNAGCHVLIEKPLAITMAEVNSIIETAQAQKRAVMCSEGSYWRAASQTARSIVARGEMGGFLFGHYVNYRYYFTDTRPAWFLSASTSGGGQFCNIGMHRLADVRCILGDGLQEVSVRASVHRIHPDYRY